MSLEVGLNLENFHCKTSVVLKSFLQAGFEEADKLDFAVLVHLMDVVVAAEDLEDQIHQENLHLVKK
jgi:hypothetical protein